MNVRLVAISKPVIQECITADGLIAYCARVSNPSNQANTQTAPKLLKYLVKHQHWSPFEMVSMTVEVRTTRAIARQMIRHRSFSVQEFSGRYAAVDAAPILSECRTQNPTNRQDSHETGDEELINWWNQAQQGIADASATIYQTALNRGIAKEVARNVLPEGMTESVLYMAGTVRSFIHYCQLRIGNGTQKEHREIARAIRAVLVEQFPSLVDALEAA